MTAAYSALLIVLMALTTAVLRFLPFIVFRRKVPPYIAYLGRVLPSAIIGMLVVYCLKDIQITVFPFGARELAASACVVVLQVWKRNSLISILAGTIIYMLLR